MSKDGCGRRTLTRDIVFFTDVDRTMQASLCACEAMKARQLIANGQTDRQTDVAVGMKASPAAAAAAAAGGRRGCGSG